MALTEQQKEYLEKLESGGYTLIPTVLHDEIKHSQDYSDAICYLINEEGHDPEKFGW